jgi:predicted O-methyltransferase YrrM
MPYFPHKIISIFIVIFMSHTINLEALRPVPWLTEGAIEFLESYLKEKPNAKILEFGSGASTVWLAAKCGLLISVDHSQKWHEIVKNEIHHSGKNKHVKLLLRERPYFTLANKFQDEYFDLVLIDGRDRVGCIQASIPKLKPGGILLLDNSERPRYTSGIKLMDSWKRFDAKQIGKDSCGFMYKGWLTSWWIKPRT